MKNLKKLLAVIVAICVLATFTVPAFAAETTAAKTDAEIATELGVILGEGGGVTADYLASQPTRLQGAIMFLRLKGLEGAAKAFTGTDNFEDVSVVNDTNKAILAYLKANPDLGFQGVGNNTFAPLKEMTAKEYYKILLVALGYEENTDFTWANVLSFAAGKGLTKLIDNEKFTVNDLCIGTVEALKTAVKGGTDTLIAKLVEGNSISADKATASGLYNPVAKALEVVSATADTLKTAKVVFNKELDKDTITAANFSNSNVTLAPKLLDDQKTVIVVFNTVKTQSSTTDVVIENVKAVDGTKIAKVTKTITFVDTTIPVISGVVAKNAKSLVISASEPINYGYDVPQILSDIKIDGSSAIGATVIDYAKNTITLNLVSILAAGTHKVDISGLKDFANYTAVAASFNIDVAEDTTAPSITSAKLNNLKEVEVTFNEDIDNLNTGDFWVNGASIVEDQDDDNPAKFKLPLGTELDIGAIVQINVEYKGQKDVVGNEVKTKTSFTFKVDDDTVLPTVTATIDKDNKITLNFSKTMYDVAGSAGTIKVNNASDNALIYSASVSPAAFKANTNKTVIELPAAATQLSNVDVKDIKVTVKDMKDGTIRKNALTETTITLKANDTNEPSVIGNYTTNDNGTPSDYTDDYVTIYFSEAMDTTTLNNLSNYVLTSGSAISLASLSGASVKSVASDQKSINIVVPGIRTSSSPDQVFSVYALKDLAGNMSNSQLSVGRLGSDTFTVVGTTAVATNKIEIEFSAPVKSFDPSVFTVRNASGFTTNAAFAIGSTISATKVSITLNQSIGSDPSGKVLFINAADKVTNSFGTTLGAFAVGVSNELGIVDGVSATPSTSAATAGSILVSFDELMDAATKGSVQYDLIVTKVSDNKLVTLADGTNTFYLDADNQTAGGDFRKIHITGLTSGADYTVELYARGLTDANGNKTAALAKTTVTVN